MSSTSDKAAGIVNKAIGKAGRFYQRGLELGFDGEPRILGAMSGVLRGFQDGFEPR